MKTFRILPVLLLLCLTGSDAFAWTTALKVSRNGDGGCSIPKMASGANGRMLLVYRRKDPDWRLMYRERSPQGVWSPVEQVTTVWSERADIIEDYQNRPMFVYTADDSGGKVDLFQAVKTGSGWSITNITNSPNTLDDYPRLAKDATGKIHMVYTIDNSVYYRSNTAGVWSAPVWLGSVTTTFYHRPDISIDPAGNLHVVYLNSAVLKYRRMVNGVWSGEVTLGTTSNFFSYVKVSSPTVNNIVVVTFDQWSQARLYTTQSSNGGTSWSPLTFLDDGHFPMMETDFTGGKAHLVYQEVGGKPILYRYWNGSTWSSQQAATPAFAWEGWPDVAVDAGGNAHVVYDDNSSVISWTFNGIDNIPPVLPTNLAAVAGDGSVQLSWTNPTDIDFTGTVIRSKTGSYPTSATDGTLVVNAVASPGSNGNLIHSPVVNGQTYYYAAFAYDNAGNYSAPAQTTATPQTLKIGTVKLLPANSFVALTGKTVSFVASAEGFMYIQEPDRSSGIRVAYSGAATQGDIVSLTGTIGPRLVSSKNAEPQLNNVVITSRVSGSVPAPVLLNNSAMGGEAYGSFQPGVTGGLGLNNMGLYCTTWGKVTAKVGVNIWIDDGSNIPDTSGRVGVMVKCPSSSILVSIGDIVSVSGVLIGSIPTSWDANRRYLQIQSFSDLVKLN